MSAKMPSTHPELLERVKVALKKSRFSWSLEDNAAWREFENRYRAIFLRLGARHGLSPEDCEDLAQEVLIAVRRQLPDFLYDRAVGPFGGWLMRIARSKVADEFRRRRKTISTEQPPSSVIHVGGVDQGAVRPEDAALIAEQMDLLLKAQRELAVEANPAHFKLFVEVCIQKRPAAEVAREMGIEPATARQIAGRMRRRLKDIVLRLGG